MQKRSCPVRAKRCVCKFQFFFFNIKWEYFIESEMMIMSLKMLLLLRWRKFPLKIKRQRREFINISFTVCFELVSALVVRLSNTQKCFIEPAHKTCFEEVKKGFFLLLPIRIQDSGRLIRNYFEKLSGFVFIKSHFTHVSTDVEKKKKKLKVASVNAKRRLPNVVFFCLERKYFFDE